MSKVNIELLHYHPRGNTIDNQWYKEILFENKKPHLNAIIILSEIVYWNRPVIEKDEKTGDVTTYRNRYKADLLQRSYESFAKQFGLSKRQVKEALDKLEVLGYIKRHFRTVNIDITTLANVLFIELNTKKLLSQSETIPRSNVRPSHARPQEGDTLDRDTYTETTTEITTDINSFKKKSTLKDKSKNVLKTTLDVEAGQKKRKPYKKKNKTLQEKELIDYLKMKAEIKYLNGTDTQELRNAKRAIKLADGNINKVKEIIDKGFANEFWCTKINSFYVVVNKFNDFDKLKKKNSDEYSTTDSETYKDKGYRHRTEDLLNGTYKS